LLQPIKVMTKRFFRVLPGMHMLVRIGAQLPPKLKSRFLVRLFGAIQNSLNSDDPVMTNLGIQSTLRVRVPSNTPSFILFGTPMQYRGERGPLHLALALCTYSRVFLDIGANLGYYIFFLRGNRAKIPIHFFEPNPELYTLIDNNVFANDLKDVIGHRLAIGNICGKVDFYLNLSDYSSSSLTKYFAGKHEVMHTQVDSTTLEEFVKANNLHNICTKIDVEAAESLVLEGSRDILNEISYLIIEVLAPAINEGFIAQLIAEGFEAYYINDYSLEHSVDGTYQYVSPEYNWLFCRESPSELQAKLRYSGIIVK